MIEYCARCRLHPGRHRVIDAIGAHPICEYCAIAVLAEAQHDGPGLTLFVDHTAVRTP